jgi:hypothetical protein
MVGVNNDKRDGVTKTEAVGEEKVGSPRNIHNIGNIIAGILKVGAKRGVTSAKGRAIA